MSHEEPREELSPLEADLASLRPRRDRVDPEWGAILAEKAQRNESAADEALRAICDGPACDNPAGHVMVCLYCGKEERRTARRFAWPVAFGLMTAVAASLFVLLAVEPRGPIAREERLEPAGPTANVRLPPPDAAAPAPGKDRPALGLPEVPEKMLAASSRLLASRWAAQPQSSFRQRERRLSELAVVDPILLDQAFAAADEHGQPSGVPSTVSQGPDEPPLNSGRLLDPKVRANALEGLL
jgi:hypothetical protein